MASGWSWLMLAKLIQMNMRRAKRERCNRLRERVSEKNVPLETILVNERIDDFDELLRSIFLNEVFGPFNDDVLLIRRAGY